MADEGERKKAYLLAVGPQQAENTAVGYWGWKKIGPDLFETPDGEEVGVILSAADAGKLHVGTRIFIPGEGGMSHPEEHMVRYHEAPGRLILAEPPLGPDGAAAKAAALAKTQKAEAEERERARRRAPKRRGD